jgi:hypothetical protein
MGLVIHRSLAMPLWAGRGECGRTRFAAEASSARCGGGRYRSGASMMIMMVRRLGTVAVLPLAGAHTWSAAVARNVRAAGMHVRTLETTTVRPAQESSDALDLVRVNDGGGWRLPLQASRADTGSGDKNRDFNDARN